MYLLDNVENISIKVVNAHRKCIWWCLWCYEVKDVQARWFSSLESIWHFLDFISQWAYINTQTPYFTVTLYWSNIFEIFSLQDISSFLDTYKNYIFRIHVSPIWLVKQEDVLYLQNKGFFNIEYYIQGNIRMSPYVSRNIHTFLDFLDHRDIRFKGDIFILWNLQDKEVFKNINVKTPVTFEKEKVVWLSECLLLGTFSTMWKKIYFKKAEKSLALDFISNWDIHVHNIPCHHAGITISNIYRSREQILYDFRKFQVFLYHLYKSWDFWSSCYKCVHRIHYHYKKFSV